MEQHAVPQHIASFEFKLFGNLTIRQFVFLAIPLGVAALIFFSTMPLFIRYGLSAIIASVGAFVALVPYNGRSIDRWVVIFIKAVTSPTQRIWKKETRIPDFLKILLEEPVVRKEAEKEFSNQDRQKLIEYLRSLPKGKVSPMDVRENLALERLGFSTEGAGEGTLPAPIFWGVSQADILAEKREEKAKKADEKIAEIKLPKGVVTAREMRGVIGQSLPGLKPDIGTGVRISPHLKQYALGGLEKRLHAQVRAKSPVKPKPPSIQLASEANFSIENIIPITSTSRQVRLVHGVPRARARKLHFAPPPGFDLSDLPIRGEARFEISEELKKRYDREEQEKMQMLNEQITSSEAPKEKESTGFEHMFSSAISQAKSLVTGGGLKAPGNQSAVPKVSKIYRKPDVIAKHITSSFPQASLKREEEADKLDSQVSMSTEKVIGKPMEPDLLTKAKMLPLTDKPNVISGMVIGADETPVEGVIVIVRDANGLPIRALKTNKLGQFLSVTPLTAGNYSLEVEGEEQNFETVSIVLTDQFIEPLMIKEKI